MTEREARSQNETRNSGEFTIRLAITEAQAYEIATRNPVGCPYVMRFENAYKVYAGDGSYVTTCWDIDTALAYTRLMAE